MFENALSNFALWADIFISALKGARAIQNFDLKELNNPIQVQLSWSYAHRNAKLQVNVMGQT